MTQRVAAALTPEEQAAVMQIQDRVIELFVDRGDAVATGNQARAAILRQRSTACCASATTSGCGLPRRNDESARAAEPA